MKEKLYLVRHETANEAGDVIDAYDVLFTDDYNDALECANSMLQGNPEEFDWTVENPEHTFNYLIIFKVEVIDGKVDYDGAQPLWTHGI